MRAARRRRPSASRRHRPRGGLAAGHRRQPGPPWRSASTRALHVGLLDRRLRRGSGRPRGRPSGIRGEGSVGEGIVGQARRSSGSGIATPSSARPRTGRGRRTGPATPKLSDASGRGVAGGSCTRSGRPVAASAAAGSGAGLTSTNPAPTRARTSRPRAARRAPGAHRARGRCGLRRRRRWRSSTPGRRRPPGRGAPGRAAATSPATGRRGRSRSTRRAPARPARGPPRSLGGHGGRARGVGLEDERTVA